MKSRGHFKKRGASFKRPSFRKKSARGYFKKSRAKFAARPGGMRAAAKKGFTAQPKDLMGVAQAFRSKGMDAAAAEMEGMAMDKAIAGGSVVTFHGLGLGQPVPQRIRTKFTFAARIPQQRVLNDAFGEMIRLVGNTLVSPAAANTSAVAGVVGFEEFSAWYENYIVYACKCTVNWTCVGENQTPEVDPAALMGDSIGVAIIPWVNATAPDFPVTWGDAMQTPNCKTHRTTKSTTSGFTTEIFVKTKQMFGPAFIHGGSLAAPLNVVGPMLSSPTWDAATNFRPTLQFLISFLAVNCTQNGSDLDQGVRLQGDVRIEYYTECFNTTGFKAEWVPPAAVRTDPLILLPPCALRVMPKRSQPQYKPGPPDWDVIKRAPQALAKCDRHVYSYGQ